MGSTLALLLAYRYFILFPLAMIEGPIVAFAAGVLVSLDYLAMIPTFTILILGDVIPDMAYYLFGEFGMNTRFMEKYMERNSKAATHLESYEKLWHEAPAKMMFMSKLAYGLSTLLLVSAGMVKVPIGKFFRLALVVTLFQYGILFFLGYHFGGAFAADRYFSYVGYAVASLVILFIALFIIMKRYAKQKLEAVK